MIPVVALLLLVATTTASAEVVDGIAAEVGGRIITISEIVTETKVMKILSSRKGSITLPVEATPSRKVLDQMINRELVYMEARRLRDFGKDVDVLDDIQRFKEKFRNPADLGTFLEGEGLTPDDLAERFRKERIVSVLIADRLTLMATVSVKEVMDYYSEHMERFADRDISEVEEEIRREISKRKGEAAIEEWLSDLKERHGVRYLGFPPFQSPP